MTPAAHTAHETAEQRLAGALSEQSRLTLRFAESAGTTSELSSYMRLRAATRAVRECEDLLAGIQAVDAQFAFSVLSSMSGPAEARAEVTRRLTEHVQCAVLHTVQLLASETVTNAIIHGSSAPAATVYVDGDLTRERVRLEVTNAGPVLDTEPGPAGAYAGRGLLLVDVMARAWGNASLAGTTTVWFEVAC